MAGQRRAPGKRPPRPVAKKSPTPESVDRQDAADAGAAKDGSGSGGQKGPRVGPTISPTSKNIARTPAPSTGTSSSPSPGASSDDRTHGVKASSSTTATLGQDAPPKANKPGSPDAGKKAATASGSKAGNGADGAAPAVTKRPASKASGTSSTPSSPGTPRPKTSTSGPVYRPPTGKSRSAARRPPPPPKRRKLKASRQTIGTLAALVVVAAVVVFFSLAVNGNGPGSSTTSTANLPVPEGVPVPKGPTLAQPASALYGQVINGISCQTNEQTVYHIHAHLTIFVNGKAQDVPYGIGIAQPLQTTIVSDGQFVEGGGCFYWLHTHSADGIMHIESPTQKTYTLGDFFAVWGQTLTKDQVGPALGKVTAYQNGKLFTGDPNTIQLTAHNQIQLDVGTPAPTQSLITFPSGL